MWPFSHKSTGGYLWNLWLNPLVLPEIVLPNSVNQSIVIAVFFSRHTCRAFSVVSSAFPMVLLRQNRHLILSSSVLEEGQERHYHLCAGWTPGTYFDIQLYENCHFLMGNTFRHATPESLCCFSMHVLQALQAQCCHSQWCVCDSDLHILSTCLNMGLFLMTLHYMLRR